MDPARRTFIKFGASVVLMVLAAGFAVTRFARFHYGGEDGAKIWFYDQKAKQLYAVPRATIPPDPNNAAGARAIVVCYHGEEGDPAKRRIAYLETYGPALQWLLERVEAARAAGQAAKEHAPTRDSEFFQTNDLVKRPSDSEWCPSNSPEGQKIMCEWRSWRSPAGGPPVVCLP